MPRTPEGSPVPRPDRKPREEYGPIPQILSTTSIIERWNAQKPWEKPSRMLIFSRQPIKDNIIRPRRKENDDIIIARGNERDTRGWVLKQMGFHDDTINNPPMDYLVAQQLMAEGIRNRNDEPLTSFHAAFVDRVTRVIPGKETAKIFPAALNDVEFFRPSGRYLETFSQTIETITKPEWQKIAAHNDQWKASNDHQLVEDLRAEKDFGSIAQVMALQDVVKKELNKHDFSLGEKNQMIVLPVELGVIMHLTAEQDPFSREGVASTEETFRIALSTLRRTKMDERTEFDEIVKHLRGQNDE